MTDINEAPVAAPTDAMAFYATPGPMTDLAGCPPGAFDGLPDDPAELCRVVQGLLVHEEWAPAYGLQLSDDRRAQVRTRPAATIVEVILAIDPAPLAEPRPPERRMVGNCRHFATLSTALLRRAGVGARARCGFASYFEPGRLVDHWITEYRPGAAWVRVDSQLDELQREILRLGFDPAGIPEGSFLPSGEAWTQCRSGKDDPSRFGIFDMWGLWFIASNVIRDLAALNKMELLPWDSWGPMAFRQDPDPGQAALLDEITTTIASDDLAAIGRLYHSDAGLAVPTTVFDGRFGETHHLGLEIRPFR
jgi:hypothetical protein